MTQILSKIIIFTITMFSCSLQSNEVHLTEGQEAPNFTLQDQEGNEHTLSSYRGKRSSFISILKMIHLVAPRKLVAYVMPMMVFWIKILWYLVLVMITQKLTRVSLKNITYLSICCQILINPFPGFMELKELFFLCVRLS